MRMLRKNKQKLKYANLEADMPVYKRDKDGNIVTRNIDGKAVPIEVGKQKTAYGSPVSFLGNIQDAGGESEATAFGLSVGSYDAVLYMMKGDLPITETSRIWYYNEPKFKTDGTVDEQSADYIVKKVPVGLDHIRYPLQRIVK